MMPLRTTPPALVGLVLCTGLGLAAMRPAGVSAAPDVPPENAATRKTPPPFPPLGEAKADARRLLEAIAHDDPDRAEGFFFPRTAFERVKGIADPGRYWVRLHSRYARDIHALHEHTPDLEHAELKDLVLSHRREWVVPRKEANRLPYWAARHNRLRYTVDGETREIEVRVMITWGTRWYITHLSEFH